VVGTGEVTASSNTAKQRFADISPNCASKAKFNDAIREDCG
jgi:hypothetical protein